MFKDQEEALRRLEAELLREEEEEPENLAEDWEESPEDWEEEESPEDWEEAPEEPEDSPYTQIPDGRIYNADRVDEDLEEFSRQVCDPDAGTRSRWAAAGALILLAVVMLVLAFLAARYGR